MQLHPRLDASAVVPPLSSHRFGPKREMTRCLATAVRRHRSAPSRHARKMLGRSASDARAPLAPRPRYTSPLSCRGSPAHDVALHNVLVSLRNVHSGCSAASPPGCRRTDTLLPVLHSTVPSENSGPALQTVSP